VTGDEHEEDVKNVCIVIMKNMVAALSMATRNNKCADNTGRFI
jgi:hypothetical protein